MNPRNRRFLGRVGLFSAGLFVLALPLYAAGFRYNETESLPPGVWRLIDAPFDSLRGHIVYFCPPDTTAFQDAKARGYLNDGPCGGNLEPLFKPVVAVAGDRVQLSDEGVRVNGGPLIENSAPHPFDGVGRALPQVMRGEHVVPPGMVWTVSSYSALSFDSRYFGAIEVASIEGEAVPVWIQGTPP